MTKLAFVLLAAGLALSIFAQAEIGYPQTTVSTAGTTANLH